jgi:hypothetical protein
MRLGLTSALLLAALLAAPSHAGIIFGRKPAPVDPRTRVPELLNVLKSDKDAAKRSKAAEELKNFDAAAFPDIVPALIRALNEDPQPGVRIDAAQSLGKIRPVSQAAGEALENALEKDPSMRVRIQTRAILLQYNWAGYRTAKKEAIPLATEPPRGVLGRFLPPIRTTPDPRKAPKAGPDAPFKPLPPGSGVEPPLAPPVPEVKPAPTPPVSRPTGGASPLPPGPVSEGPILP